jgi:hypothetical protein
MVNYGPDRGADEHLSFMICEIVRLGPDDHLLSRCTSGTGPRGHGSCRSRDSDAGYQAKGVH